MVVAYPVSATIPLHLSVFSEVFEIYFRDFILGHRPSTIVHPSPRSSFLPPTWRRIQYYLPPTWRRIPNISPKTGRSARHFFFLGGCPPTQPKIHPKRGRNARDFFFGAGAMPLYPQSSEKETTNRKINKSIIKTYYFIILPISPCGDRGNGEPPPGGNPAAC